MSKYSRDISEILSILKLMYGEDRTNFNNDVNIVLNRLTEYIDDEFLNERGNELEKYLLEHKEMQYLFSNLYVECCKYLDCASCMVAKYCNRYIKDKIENYDENAPVMVDLFCGAGGLSLGFTQNGFITSLANDIEPCCVDTYAHNHPDTPRKHIVQGDINEVINNLEELLRFKEVDVVIGGPPCQGFSTANRQRLIDDPRNKLYKSYVKVVEIIRPQFFVMENVKGMKSVADQVIEDFESIGYSVSCHILDAKDYGVPQHRERLIFIGNRININNEEIFTEIEQLSEEIPEFLLKDALDGLKVLEASRNKNATEIDSDISGKKIDKNLTNDANEYVLFINQNKNIPLVFNHKARYNNDRDIEIFSRLYQGDRADDPKIADIMPYVRRNDIFKDKYFKLESNKVCKTITAHMKFDCNMYIHPTQARGLTPREAARVQSYPDDYFFRGPYTKTYMQIGNSVPPLLGRAIAEVVKRYL